MDAEFHECAPDEIVSAKAPSEEEEEEEDDEDELEKEFDRFAAAFADQQCSRVTVPVTETERIEDASVVGSGSLSVSVSPSLTFEFPGWGLDIIPGAVWLDPNKRRKIVPFVTRNSYSCSAVSNLFSLNDSCNNLDINMRVVSATSWDWKACEGQLNLLPKEIWVQNIFPRLQIKDLCSLMQTSRSFNFLATQDEAWGAFGEEESCASSEESSNWDLGVPRWIKVKNAILSNKMKRRFIYFSKFFDHLRSVLNTWWDAQGSYCQYSSRKLHCLIQKLTAHDWTIVYEAFAVIFSERVDKLAWLLLSRLQTTALCNADRCLLKKDKFLELQPSHMKANDGFVGKEMWQNVLLLWKKYKHWLTLVSGHCQDLNYEVMVESSRQTLWSSTPSVYDKGEICFRNQILLRYKIRNALQCGLSLLVEEDALDDGNESNGRLLKSIFHLLQEVDVADDFTLPPETHTRTLLRRCFPLKGGFNKIV